MNGLLKVLSYQGAYALQEGIPEYDASTTYYIGSIVKKTGTFELYGSLTDDNVGQALTDAANWKFLIDLNIAGYTADTANMPTLTNNTTDANNDIDFGAGFCYDLTTNQKITNTALTKQLNSTFAEGDNAGGLDTGSKANSTWYYCFAISKADGTSDFLFSLSRTSPTMPSGFINKRRIASIKTNASGNIILLKQTGNYFIYEGIIQDLAGTGAVSRTALTVTCPPMTRGIFTAQITPLVETGILYVFDKNVTNTFSSVVSRSNVEQALYCEINIDANSQIDYTVVGASTVYYLGTLGYIDMRID